MSRIEICVSRFGLILAVFTYACADWAPDRTLHAGDRANQAYSGLLTVISI